MSGHKSPSELKREVQAKKRIRQNKKRNLRNKTLKSAYNTELKKFLSLIEEKNKDVLKEKLPFVHKIIDKAYSKGIISKNAASRKKSRFTILINKTITPAPENA